MKLFCLFCAIPIAFAGWMGAQSIPANATLPGTVQDDQDYQDDVETAVVAEEVQAGAKVGGQRVKVFGGVGGEGAAIWSDDRGIRHLRTTPGAAVISSGKGPRATTVFSQEFEGSGIPHPGHLHTAGPHARFIVRGPGSDKTHKAFEKLREADEDDRDEALDELRAALEEEYDQYLERQSEELERMEEKLNDLRAQLDKRRGAKNELVDLKLQTMENEALGLGWPGGGPGGHPQGPFGHFEYDFMSVPDVDLPPGAAQWHLEVPNVNIEVDEVSPPEAPDAASPREQKRRRSSAR